MEAVAKAEGLRQCSRETNNLQFNHSEDISEE